MAIVKSEDIRLIKGKEILKTYQFHKSSGAFFCSNCGIYTSLSEAKSKMVGINVACLEGKKKLTLNNINF